MIVVSNTSPMTNLACIGQLDLLRQLYDRIVIPPAVYHEIAISGVGEPGAKEVQIRKRYNCRNLYAAVRLGPSKIFFTMS